MARKTTKEMADEAFGYADEAFEAVGEAFDMADKAFKEAGKISESTRYYRSSYTGSGHHNRPIVIPLTWKNRWKFLKYAFSRAKGVRMR